VGSNTITTIVTAQDGTTTRTYTLTVTRAASTNANLSAFKISKGTLTPAFATGTTMYTASVVNGVTSLTVTPTAADNTATITVNGTTVPSGTASGAIALAVGSNTITTLVTAQDGVTTDTYTLTVTRASGGADSYVPIAIGTGISVTKPSETPTLAEDGIVVHQAVSPNGDGINDFLQIDNISQYPDNKLMIMNRNGQLVYEANGYDNSSKVFDGHSSKNGQMQLPGTYFYQLDYTSNGITKHKTGFLVLKY
jgi:gliding motility-associated-like protein